MRGFVKRLEMHTAARARAGQFVGCDETNLKALYETEPHRFVVIEQDITHFDHLELGHCASDAAVKLLMSRSDLQGSEAKDGPGQDRREMDFNATASLGRIRPDCAHKGRITSLHSA